MQIKKRAKAAKFGKKTEPSEEKKEEKNTEAVEAGKAEEEVASNEQISEALPEAGPMYNSNEAVKEDVVKEENKEAEGADEGMNNEEEISAIEKNDDNSQEEMRLNVEEKVLTGQDQQVAAGSSVNEVMEHETPANNNAYIVETEVRKNMFRYFLIIALISFLIGLASMAVVSLFLQKVPFGFPFGQRKAVEVVPTPTPTIIVEPTKVKVVNLAEYSIEVLNGSGITGAAAKLKTSLTGEGFKVVSAGNADRSDYTDTVISTKKKVNSAYLDKLKDYLKKTYVSISDSEISVPEANDADIIITIGKDI